MNYLTIAVPNKPNIVEVAKLVSKYCDPLPGGYDAYNTIALDVDGNEFAVYGSVVSDGFAENVTKLQAYPAALVELCNNDIATRWPEDQSFTLEQATLFCSNVKLSFAFGTMTGLSELELTLKLDVVN